jgi:hypothetical protein
MISKLPPRMQNKISLELSGYADLGLCWAWTGALNSRGYGCFSVDGRSQLTHRITYSLLVGTIAPGLEVDHLCRNKRCCNPDHLEAVTRLVNQRRTERASKTHCVHGHPLAGDNLKLIRKPSGVRRGCRVCMIDTARRQADRLNRGLRQTSPAVAERRALKRQQLIESGNAALYSKSSSRRSA